MKRHRKKGQVWALDVIISISIFILAIFLFFEHKPNVYDGERRLLDDVSFEANFLSQSFMSEGIPDNWNSTKVSSIGLIEDSYLLNDSKIRSLYSIDYDTARHILGTDHHFYLYFLTPDNMTLRFNASSGYGKPGINTSTFAAQDIATYVNVKRLVFYNQTIVQMMLYVW